MLGRRQEAGSAALTSWGSDEFPQLFPWWDQGWLTPLPTSDLLPLLWALLCGVKANEVIAVLPMPVTLRCLTEWSCPFQQTAPLRGQRSFLRAQILGGLSQGYV